MDIKHIREAAQKMEAAFRSAEAAKLAQEELSLLFPDETTRRKEIGRALSDQAKRARDLVESASGLLRKAADELHEKWAEGERAMRGESEFRSHSQPPGPPGEDRARARRHFEAFEADRVMATHARREIEEEGAAERATSPLHVGMRIVAKDNPEWGTWGVRQRAAGVPGAWEIQGDRGNRVLSEEEFLRFWRVADRSGFDAPVPPLRKRRR